MKARKAFVLSAAALPAVLLLAHAAHSDFRAIRRATDVRIDGERFLLPSSSREEQELVRRDFDRWMSGRPAPTGRRPPSGRWPGSGLRPARSVASSADDGSLEIGTGRVEGNPRLFLRRMEGKGWECLSGNAEGEIAFAVRRNGKEVGLVFLDTKDGSFLHLRRVDR